MTITIPCHVCGKTIKTIDPAAPEHFCKPEDVEAHQKKLTLAAVERQAGQCIEALVAAQSHIEKARSMFCAAMCSLPDEHPLRKEIERRYLMLWHDDQGNKSDGEFFKAFPIIKQLLQPQTA